MSNQKFSVREIERIEVDDRTPEDWARLQKFHDWVRGKREELYALIEAERERMQDVEGGAAR